MNETTGMSYSKVGNEVKSLGNSREQNGYQSNHSNVQKSRLMELNERMQQQDKELKYQIKSLKSQNGKMDTEIQDLDKEISLKIQNLEESSSQSFEIIRQQNLEKEKQRDIEFDESVDLKNQEIQSFIKKIKEARIELDALCVRSVDDRVLLYDQLEEVRRQVNTSRDPLYNPYALREYQNGRDNLSMRFRTLTESGENMMSRLQSTRSGNDGQDGYRMNNKDINSQFSRDIETITIQIEESDRSQREMQDDINRKLRRLQGLEDEMNRYNEKAFSLHNIYELMKRYTDFNFNDLYDRMRELEEGIITIDHGSSKLCTDIDHTRNSTEKQIYIDALTRLHKKAGGLNANNKFNGETKDELMKAIYEYVTRVMTMQIDPQSVDEETIKKQRAELTKIEKNIKSAEGIKDDQAREYEKLLNEFGDLRSDMQKDYENSIKTVQKRNEGWINETSSSIENSKALMGDLKDKLEDDNPFMKRFVRKLNNAREKYNQLKSKNDDNMATMEDLSNRKVGDGDYLTFIIELSEDQNESDMYIKDNKNASEELLKALNTINEELDDFDKTSKDEIINECRDNIHSKSKELANLEEKLDRLEKGVSLNLRTADNALQVLDENHPDYAEVTKADEDFKNLDKDTRNLRLTLDRTTVEIRSITKRVDAGMGEFSMSDIMEIQKQTSQVCRDQDDLEEGIDDGLARLKKFEYDIEKLLKVIRDQLKSDTEEVIVTVTEKITIIKKFLDPKSKDPNSINRQFTLKELLETVYLTEEDSEYTQYITYTELIKTSLTKCEVATKDLNRLDGDVTKVTNSFNKALKKDDSIINQIDHIQITFQSIRDNKAPANDLKKVTDGISEEVDSEKEQEIIDFLDKIKGQKFGSAKDRIDQLQLDLSELERRLNEVNGENDSFTSQLSKALGTSKTREKSNLIDLLIRDSDGSKKDLKRIKTQSGKLFLLSL